MTMKSKPQARRAISTMVGMVGVALTLSQAIPTLANAQAPPAPAAPAKPIAIITPTAENVAPYGSLLGAIPYPTPTGATAPTTQSQRQDMFDPGEGGKTEIVWVAYSNTTPLIGRLEKHYLTEQTVAPLTGTIIQVLALSGPDGKPDPATIRAFRLPPGTGINMGLGVWHTTRSKGSTVLMLSRSSTTDDILRRRTDPRPLIETIMVDVPPVLLPGAE